MFNWIKMCANTSNYEELHDELRACGGRYILDDVKMPESCGNHTCTIEFRYFDETCIEMICADSPVPYSGSDTRIARWLENGIAEFCSFNQLTDFLKLFNEPPARIDGRHFDRAVSDNAARQEFTVPERPTMEYDRNSITVPEANKLYIAINKDRLYSDLKSEIYGQDENLRKIVHLVRNHLGTKNKKRPISVFLYGAPGTGKTNVTEHLTEMINRQVASNEKYAYRLVDCTQFQDKADISRLTGAAPGYVGHDEPGVFSILEDNPNTIFVFDEIEKAASNVTEAIMQAMESGRQATNGKTLNNGEAFYDLSHCIIFFTSNIDIREKKQLGFGHRDYASIEEKKTELDSNIARVISQETKEAKEKLLEMGAFRREVISRMTAIIKFNDLSGDVITDIAAKCIRDAAEARRLYVTRLETTVFQEFINATSGETEKFGVRELRREAENYFADAFLDYSLEHADYAKVILSGNLNDPRVIPA